MFMYVGKLIRYEFRIRKRTDSEILYKYHRMLLIHNLKCSGNQILNKIIFFSLQEYSA